MGQQVRHSSNARRNDGKATGACFDNRDRSIVDNVRADENVGDAKFPYFSHNVKEARKPDSVADPRSRLNLTALESSPLSSPAMTSRAAGISCTIREKPEQPSKGPTPGGMTASKATSALLWPEL